MSNANAPNNPAPPEKFPCKVHSVHSTSCRICHTSTTNEALISPCNCKGTLAYVHLSCLERWLNESSRSYCELCRFRYTAIETKRYGLLEGIRLWIGHPRNRSRFRSDILVVIVLTIVTFGLIASCLFGMDYFVAEAVRLGLRADWIRLAVYSMLVVIGAAYLATMYLVGRDQCAPWFRWWTATVNIKLQLPPNLVSYKKKGARGSKG